MQLPRLPPLFLRQSCPLKHGGRIDVSQQRLKAANEASRYLYVYGFEYRYICPFRGTRERAVILDNLIQIF